MGLFERFLTVWVALGIAAGLGLGLWLRDLLRQKGTPFDELRLSNPALSDEQLLDRIEQYPIAIQRPIVKTPLGVRLCGPSELVLDILPEPQNGPFTKEDGEVVIGKGGQRA